MSREPKLTDQDAAILRCLEDHYQAYYQPPTMRYILAAVGASSTSIVNDSLKRLARFGLIRIINGKAVPLSVVRMFDLWDAPGLIKVAPHPEPMFSKTMIDMP